MSCEDTGVVLSRILLQSDSADGPLPVLARTERYELENFVITWRLYNVFLVIASLTLK